MGLVFFGSFIGYQAGSFDPHFCCDFSSGQVEKAVSEAIGGVLFIDEAYALVRDGKESDEWMGWDGWDSWAGTGTRMPDLCQIFFARSFTITSF